MMQPFQFILQDDPITWKNLLPLTYTRPISGLRVGIDTIQEKWEHFIGQAAQIKTESYLLPKFENNQPAQDHQLIINSCIIPTEEIVSAISSLKVGQQLLHNDIFIAKLVTSSEQSITDVQVSTNIISLNFPWELFKKNEAIFKLDFNRITAGRTSQPIPETNQVRSEENIFIEPGADVQFSILDAFKGPIYLGKNSTILAGCMIMGGLALCEDSVLKMGAKHYGTSTLGPGSKFGGEFSNVVVQGCTNKGHDGYLGNAVLGEWCNLGADTNASNLKNNYGPVRVWNYSQEKFIQTDTQFCGLIMGDHAKAGINTMFNTATVVGVGANIFGANFPKTFLPSFTWGGVDFQRTFILSKVFEMAEAMMSRRKIPFSEADKAILEHIFEESKKYRKN